MIQTSQPAEELVALTGLDDIGYREGFRVAVPPGGPVDAESWARATLEGAPRPMRRFLRIGWPLLGIRLGPAGSTEHVHGWRVVHRSPNAVVLGVESRLIGVPRIVVTLDGPDGERVLDWVMAIRYRNAAGRRLWLVIAPGHRAFVRELLRHVSAPDRFH